MKKINLILILLSCTASVHAQTLERQVIGSSGGSFSSGTLQVDHTTGEMAIGSATTGTFTVSQGFHQAMLFRTSIADKTMDVRFSLFPNPATDQITLALQAAQPFELRLSLTTATGQVVFADQDAEVANENYKRVIPTKSLAAGVYFLNLHDPVQGVIRHIQFVKQ